MNNNNIHIDAADHIISKRVCRKTSYGYRGKLNHIKLFITTLSADDEYRDLMLFDENGELIIPLPQNVIEKLFGWLSTNTDLPKKARRSRAAAVVVIDDAKMMN